MRLAAAFLALSLALQARRPTVATTASITASCTSVAVNVKALLAGVRVVKKGTVKAAGKVKRVLVH